MNQANPPLIRVAPGTYPIGCPPSERFSEGDWDGEREVALTRAFEIGRVPVTRKAWRAVMGSDPSHFQDGEEDCPVESVSWFDALYYLNRRSELEGLPPAYRLHALEHEPGAGTSDEKTSFRCQVEFPGLDSPGYRLPTEAEWEVAARAGCSQARHGKLGQVAWYGRNSQSRPHPVGEKLPNDWGLLDTLGNVGEWVWDRWGIPPKRASDPLGPEPTHTENRMIRGYGWVSSPKEVRFAYRNGAPPTFRIYYVGLRVARTVI